jgi:CDP-L-myo-inositol myo-inositolphosphotransferase
MSDHLYAPSLIKRVLQTRPQEGTVSLAVDRDKTGIFDTSDATKVTLSDGRVIRIGKTLREWDAADTGVFLCTEALFGVLEHVEPREPLSLSDAMNELAAAGRVDAVDVTGEEWIDVDTPEAFDEARRRLLHSLPKERGDGYVSAWLNRPISKSISARLAMTDISPNQLTVISFAICVLGAGLLSAGQFVAGLFGGLLVQVASVVDGCDGEIARLKDRGSARGAWLDTILDRVADMAIALGVTYAFAMSHPAHVVWIIGFLAAFGFVLASYVTKEFELQHDRPYPGDVLNRLKRRDLRLLLIFLGAMIGRPFEAVAVAGLLSYVCVIGIVGRGWRESGKVGRPRNPAPGYP